MSLTKRLVTGFLAMIVVVFGGATGYWLIGRGQWEYFDCMYMTVITVTTVGNDVEVHPKILLRITV